MYYRRAHAKGGSFFFTVNIADRSQDWLVMNVDSLRDVVRVVCKRHPFEITAMVVLPDHLHAVWKLPEGDDDAVDWPHSSFSRYVERGKLTASWGGGVVVGDKAFGESMEYI